MERSHTFGQDKGFEGHINLEIIIENGLWTELLFRK